MGSNIVQGMGLGVGNRHLFQNETERGVGTGDEAKDAAIDGVDDGVGGRQAG